MPLALRSAFYPLAGDKIYGWFGDAVDIFAVVATLFGVATSLGYGVLQINAGFAHVFGLPQMHVTLLVALCLAATLSAATGHQAAFKRQHRACVLLYARGAVFGRNDAAFKGARAK